MSRVRVTPADARVIGHDSLPSVPVSHLVSASHGYGSCLGKMVPGNE